MTAIDGDRVTFDVNTGRKGADGSVTLTAPEVSVTMIALPDFAVDCRYLITATGSTINARGYLLDYATAGEWATAFARLTAFETGLPRPW